MEKMAEQIDYCMELVRADDRARYEATLLAPGVIQPALWALYAFNQEVAKTRENVSESALGEIRLQWWRDVLDEIKQGHVREHPVVAAVAEYLADPTILTLLGEIIDARALDLYDDGPADFKALKKYAYSVGGALSEAALRLSSKKIGNTSTTVNTARSCGSAWAMLGLVRAIPFHWASNRNFIPGEEGKQSLAIQDAEEMFRLAAPSISEMVTFVENEAASVRQMSGGVSSECRHVFLLNSLTALHLKNLRKVGGNPFKANEPSSLRRMTALAFASWF